VPNLILQPLVENAIKHGLAAQRAPGRIDVRARRLNGSLQVQIQDNGRGLQDARMAETLNQKTDNIHGEGIGLRTTLARLERLYPNAHQLQLQNAPEGGLIVTLEVPFKTEADEISVDGKSL
jgi:sensor histidine kinase YesM